MTDEVQAIVRLYNKYKISDKPSSIFWGKLRVFGSHCWGDLLLEAGPDSHIMGTGNKNLLSLERVLADGSRMNPWAKGVDDKARSQEALNRQFAPARQSEVFHYQPKNKTALNYNHPGDFHYFVLNPIS